MKSTKLLSFLIFAVMGLCPASLSAQSEKSFEEYLEAAKQGDAEAQLQVGKCYFNGNGVQEDDVEARQWFLKAAEQGNGEAARIIGLQYRKGYGVEKDIEEAIKWYKKAVELGNGEGANALAYMYVRGDGVEKDIEETIKWYKKAVELGEGKGAKFLGFMYLLGDGVQKDIEEAIKWYKKAAELGDGIGAYQLGYIYKQGNDVQKDIEEAIKWYKKAVELGEGAGANSLATMYLRGDGVEENIAEAFKWFKKGVELGDEQSAWNLCQIYCIGIDVDKDLREAKKWALKAKELGYDENEINEKLAEINNELGLKQGEIDEALATKPEESNEASATEPETIEKDTVISQKIMGTILNEELVPTQEFAVKYGKSDGTPKTFKSTIAKLEIINMGDEGNTVILDINDPDPKRKMTLSWSGPTVRVYKREEKGNPQFFVIRGDDIACGGLLRQSEDEWCALVFTKTECQTISDLKKGMSRQQVQNIVTKLGFSQFKPAGTTKNGLKIYTLQWLNMEKRYNFLRTDYHYEMNNQKEYAKFYFNSQDKLVKWIFR